MKIVVSLSLFVGLASATFPTRPYSNYGGGYMQALPARITSLTMSFPQGNPFRPGENFVDLGRTGPYYLGNRHRGYTIYPTHGISHAYNRMFGGGNFGGGLLGGNMRGGYLGGNLGGGFLGGNLGGGFPGGNLGGGFPGGNLGGGFPGGNLGGRFLGGHFGGRFHGKRKW
ncbi:keratin, type I cytoskeletal 10-like [Ostrea edulis]|uniref:keratin, type I cytoskeletal 10-like n=1 Tax=Ostrea edulis TaxID=37623 RepID=UPI0024AF5180|nr:keratin, type I cytoskeletal 10-like [Ostrea edulis]